MSQAIKKRDTAALNVERYLRLSKKLTPDTTRESVVVRIARLKNYWADFEENQNLVDKTCGNQNELGIQNVERVKVDEYYVASLINLETFLNSFPTTTPPPEQQNPTNRNEIKLPTINLPTFSGKYDDWPAFENLFKSIIHRNLKLSNCQKLHYLKANLDDEAAELIKNYPVTDLNYAEAWTVFQNRFSNKRFIIDAHLKPLFNLPKHNTETATGLRLLRDKSAEILRCLNALEQPTQHWGTIIIYLLVSKFDKTTHRYWEMSLNRQKLPTYDELLAFLDTRWQGLDSVISPETTNTKPAKQHLKPTIHHAAVNKPQCPCCKSEHYINQCEKFLKMNYSSKTEFVKSNNLCFNCLKSGHSSLKCMSSCCRKCNRKHHTLLHNESQGNTNSLPAAPKPTVSTLARSENQTANVNSNFSSQIAGQVLLSTAVVIIKTDSGQYPVRALIDSGSKASFISKKMARQATLKEYRTMVTVNGIGNLCAGKSTSCVDFTLLSRFNNRDFSINVEALTMEKITSDLPINAIDASEFIHCKTWN